VPHLTQTKAAVITGKKSNPKKIKRVRRTRRIKRKRKAEKGVLVVTLNLKSKKAKDIALAVTPARRREQEKL
jgi:hypothetical protein